MAVNALTEKGYLFFQCDECGEVSIDFEHFAYGHDCEMGHCLDCDSYHFVDEPCEDE